MIVTVVFAVSWGPNQIYYMMYLLQYDFGNTVYWWTIVFAFLNLFVNPFVYAYKHETIRKQVNKWLRLDGRNKSVGPTVETGNSVMPG